jgi:hypothetical protein
MPQFVIERDLEPGAIPSDAQIEADSLRSLQVLRELGPEIQWVHSFVTDGKIYCIYSAPDETLILEHARRGGFRADRVAAVKRLLEPGQFGGPGPR